MSRQENVRRTKEALSKITSSAARDAADSILFIANDLLTAWGVDDEGTLRSSGVVVPNDEGGFDVVFLAEHASWVHDGTAGHSVSEEGQQRILEWVSRKLKPTPNKGESQAAANLRVAKAVVWKIRKHGVEGRPFLQTAYELYLDGLRRDGLVK